MSEGCGVRSFDRQVQSPAPNLGGHDSEGPRDAEKHGVVVELVEAEVHEESARASVHVGPGVLGLALLGEHARSHLVDHVDQLEERIVGQVLEAELHLRGVARIGLAQHGVAVAGDDLASLESLPGKLGDGLVVHLLAYRTSKQEL